jgi:hypothetical protein
LLATGLLGQLQDVAQDRTQIDVGIAMKATRSDVISL